MSDSSSSSSASPTTPRILALLNQKGGVGKTTTTVNLGAALSQFQSRILYLDLDPQAHLTLHLGLDPNALEHSLYDLYTNPDMTASQIMQQVSTKLFVLPAEVNLAGIESELAHLAQQGQAQLILRDKVHTLIDAFASAGEPLDTILIDCPPSLGLLTVSALALAHEVIVPMQTHFLALQGLSKLLDTVSMVRQSLNPKLTVAGVVLCMHEAQTVLANEVIKDLQSFLDAARSTDVPWNRAVIFQPPIRRNIKLAECPGFGKTIFDYAPTCPGAWDYRALADSVTSRVV